MLYIIDQTPPPNEEKEIELRTVEEMIEAIKMLRIRGAPAIGICAGYCMYALARDIDAKDNEDQQGLVASCWAHPPVVPPQR